MNRPSTQRTLAKFQAENRVRHNTKAVAKVANQLEAAGIKAIREKGFMADHNTFVLVDLYLPKPYKLCIEVDGGYHEIRKDKDKAKDKYLTEVRNFKVLRVSNEQVLEETFSILDLI